MHHSLKQSLLAGASALVLSMGAAGAAWAADADANVTLHVHENDSTDNGAIRNNETLNSGNNASGIDVTQQNNGNNNAIGQSTAVTSGLIGGGDVDVDATVEGETHDNNTVHDGQQPFGLADRANNLRQSFNGFAGQATVQQNNGDHNVIGAATAVYGSSGTHEDATQNADAASFTSNQFGANDGEPLEDEGSARTNLINPSFNNSDGIATVQQNNGNGNAISAATAVLAANDLTGNLTQTADADADASDNSVTDNSLGLDGGDNGRTNEILNSFNNADGVVTVQQNNGDANALAAATAVAGSAGNVDNVTQIVTADENDLNDVTATDNTDGRLNSISGSFSSADGMVTVQQNNGNVNNMAAATGVVGIGDPDTGTGSTADTDQFVSASFSDIANDGDVTVTDAGSTRTNDITNSFNNASGIFTVQQNNGDGNTINAATGVIGVGFAPNGSQTVSVDVEASDGTIDVGENAILADNGSTRSNSIDPSFVNASGVVTVQQNNGSGNVMQAATGVSSFTVSDNDSLSIDVDADNGIIDEPEITITGVSTRNNDISGGSFNGASGTVTVQQNNGDGNVMQSATGVIIASPNAHLNSDLAQVDNEADDNNVQDVTIQTPSTATRFNDIAGSFNNVAGTATVQQNNGNANVMNASQSVHVANTAGLLDGDLTQDDVDAEDNTIDGDEMDLADNGSTRDNAIASSFNPAAGVTTVQQNNGDANILASATSVGTYIGSVGGASNTILQNVDVQDNDVEGTGDAIEVASGGGTRTNAITNSFRNAAGVHTVQQNNGDANIMSAATGVVAVTGFVASDVDQNVDLHASTVDNIDADDFDSTRSNTIDPSFTNASGVVTVQQNNGNANSINAATAVVSVTTKSGGGGSITQVVDTDASTVSNVVTSLSGTARTNDLTSVLNGFSGVATVQQNNGDANVMVAGTAVATTGSSSANNDEIDQTVYKGGNVDDVDVFPFDGIDLDTEATNTANSVLNNASGIATIQQNNGNGNVIGAGTAVASASGGAGGVSADQRVFGWDNVNDVDVLDVVTTKTNTVSGSLNSFSGVATVQQNNGHGNVVSAGTAVANNDSHVDQTVEKHQSVSDVFVVEVASAASNSLTASGVGASGVMTVQQNNGHGNTIDAATAVGQLDAEQDVSTSGDVQDTIVVEAGGALGLANNINTNAVAGSFNRASGVATVQQNNGHANAIAAATGVVYTPFQDEPDQTASATGSVGGGDFELGLDILTSRTNDIASSFGTFSGVAIAQQNNGSNNTLQVATAVEQNSGVNENSEVTQHATASGSVVDNIAIDILSTPRENEILNSFNRASGIVTVQQNNGDANALSAATAVANLSGSGATGTLSQTAEATGDVSNGFSSDTDEALADPNQRGQRVNTIDPSFANASGVATVQQNNGSNNALSAATAVLTDSTTTVDGDNETVLDQLASATGSIVDSNHTITDSTSGAPTPSGNYDRTNDILNSFGNYNGVGTVQQNNGDNNIIASATAVAAKESPAGGQTDDWDGVDGSTAQTDGTVANSEAEDPGFGLPGGVFQPDEATNRINTIANSFNNNTAGIVTVQQNNGNNNAVLAATAVTAQLGNIGNQDSGAVESTATGDADVTDNTATGGQFVDRFNDTTNSFRGFRGIASVQQNNGDNNVVAASTDVVASETGTTGFGPATSLATLSATVTGNSSSVNGTNGVDPGYRNLVSGSFNNASGVITVQQNTGNNNAIQSAISVTANF